MYKINTQIKYIIFLANNTFAQKKARPKAPQKLTKYPRIPSYKKILAPLHSTPKKLPRQHQSKPPACMYKSKNRETIGPAMHAQRGVSISAAVPRAHTFPRDLARRIKARPGCCCCCCCTPAVCKDEITPANRAKRLFIVGYSRTSDTVNSSTVIYLGHCNQLLRGHCKNVIQVIQDKLAKFRKLRRQ